MPDLLRRPTGRQRCAYSDLLLPPGYRFLVQSRDFATEQEFRDWLLATFGPAKSLYAKVVRGFNTEGSNQNPNRFTHRIKTGFRAYLRKARP